MSDLTLQDVLDYVDDHLNQQKPSLDRTTPMLIAASQTAQTANEWVVRWTGHYMREDFSLTQACWMLEQYQLDGLNAELAKLVDMFLYGLLSMHEPSFWVEKQGKDFANYTSSFNTMINEIKLPLRKLMEHRLSASICKLMELPPEELSLRKMSHSEQLKQVKSIVASVCNLLRHI